MSIARRGTPTTAAMTSGGTTLTISVPAGVINGDLMVLVAFGNDNTGDTFNDPAGWTAEDLVTSGTNTRMKVWWRAASSEPASYAVTIAGGVNTKYVATITAYSGVNTTTPFSAHAILAETVAQTTHTTSSITPGSVNDWVVCAFGDRSTTAGSKNTNWTPTAPAAEQADVNNNAAASSPWCALEWNDDNGTVGSTASTSRSSTSVISQANACMWIGSLSPAAVSGTPPRVTYSQPESVVPDAALSQMIKAASHLGNVTPRSLRPVVYAPAEDLLSYQTPPARGDVLGGRPNSPVTPRTLRQLILAQTEDVLSNQLHPYQPNVYGGKPNKPVTPPTPRVPLVVPAEDVLSNQLPPAGNLYGGEAIRPVTPPTLRNVIFASQTEDVYSNQIPPSQAMIYGGEPYFPVTNPTLRSVISTVAEDTYSYTVPPSGSVLGGDPNRNVTPPTLRNVLFSQEPVTVGAETGSGSVLTNRFTPPVVVAGQGIRNVLIVPAEDVLSNQIQPQQVNLLGGEPSRATTPPTLRTVLTPQEPVRPGDETGLATLLRPLLVSPGRQPTRVQVVNVEPLPESVGSVIFTTKVTARQKLPAVSVFRAEEPNPQDTGSSWLTFARGRVTVNPPRVLIVSQEATTPEGGSQSLQLKGSAGPGPSQLLPGVTFAPQEPSSPYTGCVVFVNAPPPKNASGVTKQDPTIIADEYLPTLTVTGSAGGGRNVSTPPPALVQTAIQPRVQPKGSSSREADVDGSAGG